MKLDIGCGKNKKPGFTGIDQYPMEGVDIVADLKGPWPIESGTVEEIHSAHVLEHFTGEERVHFVNEMYRIMLPDAKAYIVTPHWSSNRAYGDFTHQWPPVSEMWFYYLSKEWRLLNAPHNDISWNPKGYDCNFECTWGYSLHPSLTVRSTDYQQHASQFWLEARQDMHATLTRR